MKGLAVPGWARRDLASVQGTLRGFVPESLGFLWDNGVFDLPGCTEIPIRPYLLLLGARHYGCTGERVVRLAACIQMIYLGSLLHDRLGCSARFPALSSAPDPGSHQREAMDILLGDLFFSKASCLIVEDGERRIIEENIRTSLASAETQATLADMNAKPDLLEAGRCFEVMADKVSLLLSLSLRIGAIIGKAPKEHEEAFAGFGHILGRLLRILEDLSVWDLSSDGAGPTLEEARFGYPMILLWEKEGRGAWRELLEGLCNPASHASGEVRSRLEGGGYLAAARKVAARMATQAAERLEGMRPETDELRLLRTLPQALVGHEGKPAQEVLH